MEILIETFNGKGYSEPKITKNATVDYLNEIINHYDSSFKKTYNVDDVMFNNGEYQGRLKTMSIPDNSFVMIEIRTDVNESSIVETFASEHDALKSLNNFIYNSGRFIDVNEINEHETTMCYFGGHTYDGFLYTEIIKS